MLSSWSNVGILAMMIGGACVTGLVNWVHMDASIADLKQTVVQQGATSQHQIDTEQAQINQHAQLLANHEGRLETLEKTPVTVVIKDEPHAERRYP